MPVFKLVISQLFLAGANDYAGITFDAPVPDGQASLYFQFGANGWECVYNTAVLEWEAAGLDWRSVASALFEKLPSQTTFTSYSDFLGRFNAGQSVTIGTSSGDTLNGTGGADIIAGGDGNDVIDGGFGSDTLVGGNGDDTFTFSSVSTGGTSPNGLINGGSGTDTLDLSRVSPAFLGTMQNASGAYVLGAFVGSIKFELKSIETIRFGPGDQSMYLPDAASRLEIYAGGGADYVQMSGATFAHGEDGNDIFFVSGSFGTAPTAGGVYGDSGVDTLRLNIGATVDLAAGTAVLGTSSFSVSGIENVQASVYKYLSTDIRGDDAANVLSVLEYGDDGSAGILLDGRGGNDILVGSMGADTILGGAGNDLLNSRAGNDYLDGGAGIDRATYSALFRSYSPAISATGVVLHGAASEGTDSLRSVEYITFKDGVLVSDPDSAASQIARLYDTVLQRAPDAGGQDHYTDLIQDHGGTLLNVANDLLGSAEFQAATGNLNSGQYVDYVYQHALGRAADAAGRAYYVGQLDQGMSRASLLVSFSESSEHRALTAETVGRGYFDTDDSYQAVALFYDSFVGRRPDSGGLIYYGDALREGRITLAQMAQDFAGSAEFRGATAGLNNGQIVDFMYQNTLDRAADAGGRAYYVDRLDHGMTTANLLYDFAQSAEHYALIGPGIFNGIDVL